MSDNDPLGLRFRASLQTPRAQRLSLGSSLSGALEAIRSDEMRNLSKQIETLQQQISAQITELEKKSAETAKTNEQNSLLKSRIDELLQKTKLDFILRRISSNAQDVVLKNRQLLEQFASASQCKAFVMSVDIRRSTSLMLKARLPQDFADFIDELCLHFAEIIKRNHGVYDKFTGDGVLAFFPDFYSGTDAGYFAVQSALECHRAFESHYRESRRSFTSVLTNVGLGIGIDFGEVSLLQGTDGLTVVGGPVVYACRLGGAPAGATYLNQPAFEEIHKLSGQAFLTSETELEIKHEGPMLAYSVTSSGVRYEPAPPAWQSVSLVSEPELSEETPDND